jgi:hypothetical protein
MGKVSDTSKLAGAAALGLTVALGEQRAHTHPDVYRPTQAVGHQVFVVSSTANMNNGSHFLCSTDLVLSPRFS